jgi:hypothetical protein
LKIGIQQNDFKKIISIFKDHVEGYVNERS